MNHCLFCNIETSNPKFCSKSHAAKFNNSIRPPRSKESKLKTSLSVKAIVNTRPSRNGMPFMNCPPKPGTCSICNKLHIRSLGKAKTCSVECQRIHASKTQSERMSCPEYRSRHNYGRGKLSYLESSFIDWLSSHNFHDYETEVKFYNSTLKKTYFVDFLFQSLKLIIELDGTQHLKTIEQDNIRDNFLLSLGYTVIRISYKDYQSKTRMPEIKQLLNMI